MNDKKNKNLSIPDKDNWLIFNYDSENQIELEFWENLINIYLLKNKIGNDFSYKSYIFKEALRHYYSRHFPNKEMILGI